MNEPVRRPSERKMPRRCGKPDRP